jgi:L-ascorbate metabolism protein UlaG (beta-lactamase superfamily)
MSDLRTPYCPAQGDAVTWFGQACFRITDAEGHTVLVDPYAEPVMGQSLQGLAADVVIITHEHPDHNATEGIKARHLIHAVPLIHNGQVKRIGDAPTGLIFTLIPTFHDPQHGEQRGLNSVVVWQEGGVTLCHLGDLGHPLTREQIAGIGRPDVLMLPVGGTFTLDGEEARMVVEQLKPHVVIPMHYKVPGMSRSNTPLTTVEPFLDANGNPPWSEVKQLDSPMLMIDADHLPANTEVDVLQVAKIQ